MTYLTDFHDETAENEVPASEDDYKIEMDDAEADKDIAETDYEKVPTAYDNQSDYIEILTNVDLANAQSDIDDKNEEIAYNEPEIEALNDLITLLNSTITEWTDQRDAIEARQGELQPQADALLAAFNDARDAKVSATADYDQSVNAIQVKRNLLNTLKNDSESG